MGDFKIVFVLFSMKSTFWDSWLITTKGKMSENGHNSVLLFALLLKKNLILSQGNGCLHLTGVRQRNVKKNIPWFISEAYWPATCVSYEFILQSPVFQVQNLDPRQASTPLYSALCRFVRGRAFTKGLSMTSLNFPWAFPKRTVSERYQVCIRTPWHMAPMARELLSKGSDKCVF